VVLYFWSGGCGYCTEQKPIINELEDGFKNSNVTFYWLDYSKHKDLTDHYDVYGFPTTILVTKSGIHQKFVGYTEYDSIASEIKLAIDSYE
jgi:thiol-disulfide isomerase/thioredoxin